MKKIRNLKIICFNLVCVNNLKKKTKKEEVSFELILKETHKILFIKLLNYID